VKRKCDWPRCTATSDQSTDGWAFYIDAVVPGMPEQGHLCPHHGLAYDARAVNEQPPTPAKH
jgi:hypothetical protein